MRMGADLCLSLPSSPRSRARRGGTGRGGTCGFSGRRRSAAGGSARSREGVVVELRQSARGGSCERGGAGGRAGGCMAAPGQGFSGEAGVQAPERGPP